VNVWLFSIGILVFLLTVYGTVMIGGFQLRMARLDQQRQEEDEHAVADVDEPSDAPSR
jgi:hypothetical protein